MHQRKKKIQTSMGGGELCLMKNLPANGTSVTYSTQSVDALRSDDTELSDPLDAFNE